MFSTIACSLDDEWFFSEDASVAKDPSIVNRDLLCEAILNFDNTSDGPDHLAQVSADTPEFRISQVQRFADAFNTGGCDGILAAGPELFHQDAVLHDPNLGVYTGDWGAICEYWKTIWEAYDGVYLCLTDIRSSDAATVIASWRLTGRHVKPSFGIPASFKHVELCGEAEYTFRGTKMCKVSWTWSGIALVQQLLGLAGAGLANGMSSLASGMWKMVTGVGQILHGPLRETSSQEQANREPSPPAEFGDVPAGAIIPAPVPAVKSEYDMSFDTQPHPSIKSEWAAFDDADAVRRTEIEVDRQIQAARAAEPWYACGYCGIEKTSASTGRDGRVRIRCECGGKHKDRKARMHANWRPVSAASRKSVYQHGNR